MKKREKNKKKVSWAIEDLGLYWIFNSKESAKDYIKRYKDYPFYRRIKIIKVHKPHTKFEAEQSASYGYWITPIPNKK